MAMWRTYSCTRVTKIRLLVVREFLSRELGKPLTPHRLSREQAVEITGAGHGISGTRRD